jgi:hypothetical protein
VDYNPASVGQLPNESTAVIIFERPDGDRNYAARDFSSSRFPRASCSACHGLETPTQNDVEGREIDFLAVLGRVEPVRVYEIIAPAGCLSAAEQELCGLFAEGWRPIAPGTGTSGSGILRSVWRSCQGAAGAPSVPNVQIGMPRHRGPRVRIRLAPAESQQTFGVNKHRTEIPGRFQRGRTDHILDACARAANTSRTAHRRPVSL